MLEVTCKAGELITLTNPVDGCSGMLDREGADLILLAHAIEEPGNLKDVEPYLEGGGGQKTCRPAIAAMTGE